MGSVLCGIANVGELSQCSNVSAAVKKESMRRDATPVRPYLHVLRACQDDEHRRRSHLQPVRAVVVLAREPLHRGHELCNSGGSGIE
jgi:hypothetical protein